MARPAAAYVAFQRFGLGARPGDWAAIAGDPRAAVLSEIADAKAALLIGPLLLSTSQTLIEDRKAKGLRREFKRAAVLADRGADGSQGMAAAAPGDMDGPEIAADMAGGDMKGGDMAGAEMGGAAVSDQSMSNADMAGKKKKGAAATPKVPSEYRYARVAFQREIEARLERGKSLRVGYVERLVSFWSNHFAIEGDKNAVKSLVGAYEREAIRPYVLGRFRDMLGAVAKHPAMLLYLDNWRSVGPTSVYGRARGEGLNENFARETLELHTLGVDGGYTQNDVIAFAKVLTGWTIFSRRDPEVPGTFMFSAVRHEPGEQTILGRAYPPDGAAQGEAVLDDLARHPSTARNIARQFATAFVADIPPAGLVERLAQVFVQTDGDLGALARALASDDEAWDLSAAKFRSPREYLFAAVRALDLSLDGQFVRDTLRGFGEEPWNPSSPQGFTLRSADWIAPDALTNRLDLAQILATRADAGIDPRALLTEVLGDDVSRETRDAVARSESPQQGIALLLMSPEFQRR